MKKLIFSLFLVAFAATNLFASNTQVDGIWYDLDSSTKTASVTYHGTYSSSYTNEYSGSVVIPEKVTYNSTTYSVTTIGYEAFSDCSDLTSVTIPNSVTTIGNYAFAYCSGLTSITIPNSVTTIGYDAFCNVTNIVYNGTATGSPWGAKYVNGYVDGYLVYNDASKTILCGCSSAVTGEVTIPNSVTTIGDRAFNGCTGLTSVTIGNSVTTIGNWAFSDCSGLTSVTIGNSVTTIGESAFYDCSGLTSITIPNSVTTIGEWAFSSCTGLTSITIPNSVTTIGNQAFYCFYLTSINVDVANTHYCSVDGVLFDYAKDTLIQYPIGNTRAEYIIPNSVTTIGQEAFERCSGLTSITIPNSVTTIWR